MSFFDGLIFLPKYFRNMENELIDEESWEVDVFKGPILNNRKETWVYYFISKKSYTVVAAEVRVRDGVEELISALDAALKRNTTPKYLVLDNSPSFRGGVCPVLF